MYRVFSSSTLILISLAAMACDTKVRTLGSALEEQAVQPGDVIVFEIPTTDGATVFASGTIRFREVAVPVYGLSFEETPEALRGRVYVASASLAEEEAATLNDLGEDEEIDFWVDIGTMDGHITRFDGGTPLVVYTMRSSEAGTQLVRSDWAVTLHITDKQEDE